jgi:hypothetical protein
MPDPRPAFTLDAGAPVRPELPIGAWVAAAGGIGVTAGALVAGRVCPPLAYCASPPAAALVGVACAAGALAWIALPVKRGGEAPVRLAALLVLLAGVLLGTAVLQPNSSVIAFIGLAAAGASAPCAMLPALRPDASLTLVGQDARPPRRWLQSGAMPSAAIVGGLGLGAAEPRAILAGPALLILAGLITLGLASIPEPRRAPEDLPNQSRLRAVFRMTPMLRHATVADCSVAFIVAGCAAAFADARWSEEGIASAGAALALGGALGAFVWTLAAPRADALWGRGALLTLAFLCACGAPLALAGSLSSSGAPLLLVAGALAAFALGSSTQRYALLFDLAASRGRARIAADLQALKLLAAAAGPLALAYIERAAPGLGLIVISAVGFAALSTFAPTLGSLGRRTT